MATATRSKSKTKKTATKRSAARKPGNLTVWKGIVAKAWKDRAFRERLMEDPNGVLAEHGFKSKKGRSYRVVADSKSTKHLILPESARTVRVKSTGSNDPDPGF